MAVFTDYTIPILRPQKCYHLKSPSFLIRLMVLQSVKTVT
jgi:hypothetical protein